jgi:hypothetical protein
MIRGLLRSRPQSLRGGYIRLRRQSQVASLLSGISIIAWTEELGNLLLQLVVQKGGAFCESECTSSALL